MKSDPSRNRGRQFTHAVLSRHMLDILTRAVQAHHEGRVYTATQLREELNTTACQASTYSVLDKMTTRGFLEPKTFTRAIYNAVAGNANRHRVIKPTAQGLNFIATIQGNRKVMGIEVEPEPSAEDLDLEPALHID